MIHIEPFHDTDVNELDAANNVSVEATIDQTIPSALIAILPPVAPFDPTASQ